MRLAESKVASIENMWSSIQDVFEDGLVDHISALPPGGEIANVEEFASERLQGMLVPSLLSVIEDLCPDSTDLVLHIRSRRLGNPQLALTYIDDDGVNALIVFDESLFGLIQISALHFESTRNDPRPVQSVRESAHLIRSEVAGLRWWGHLWQGVDVLGEDPPDDTGAFLIFTSSQIVMLHEIAHLLETTLEDRDHSEYSADLFAASALLKFLEQDGPSNWNRTNTSWIQTARDFAIASVIFAFSMMEVVEQTDYVIPPTSHPSAAARKEALVKHLTTDLTATTGQYSVAVEAFCDVLVNYVSPLATSSTEIVLSSPRFAFSEADETYVTPNSAREIFDRLGRAETLIRRPLMALEIMSQIPSFWEGAPVRVDLSFLERDALVHGCSHRATQALLKQTHHRVTDPKQWTRVAVGVLIVRKIAAVYSGPYPHYAPEPGLRFVDWLPWVEEQGVRVVLRPLLLAGAKALVTESDAVRFLDSSGLTSAIEFAGRRTRRHPISLLAWPYLEESQEDGDVLQTMEILRALPRSRYLHG